MQAKKLIEEGKIESRTFPWAFSRHLKNGLACVHSISLVENIGFGTDSTPTKTVCMKPIVTMEFKKPLKINIEIVPDKSSDLKFINTDRIANVLYKVLRILKK